LGAADFSRPFMKNVFSRARAFPAEENRIRLPRGRTEALKEYFPIFLV
jgi:hypothetical protein